MVFRFGSWGGEGFGKSEVIEFTGKWVYIYL